MTVEMFRSSPVHVAGMRELLQSPILAEAIVCLKDDRPSTDAADAAPEVVSVRLLSRQFQHDQVIATLLSLAEPLPLPEIEPPPNFGVDTSKFKQTPA